MWHMKRIAVILVITVITAIVGAVLWNSEAQQVLSDVPIETCEGWCLGTDDAPVVLKSFTDFT